MFWRAGLGAAKNASSAVVATCCAAGLGGFATVKYAHAASEGGERHMLTGAEGPEWASHILGKRPWKVHSACIAANLPIEDR
jgi:hypothetical protein